MGRKGARPENKWYAEYGNMREIDGDEQQTVSKEIGEIGGRGVMRGGGGASCSRCRKNVRERGW